MAETIKDTAKPTIDTLIDLIATLTGEKGCPWDRKQTPATLTVYLIEEMFELVEAINANDVDGVLEELGDVLFQIIFVAHLFQKDNQFSMEQVLGRIIDKMVRRHPHVFGSESVENAGQVKEQWRRIKQQEKGMQDSLLDSVPSGMPALMRAYRISERAAATGFDWDDLAGVMAQAEDEWSEFQDEVGKAGAMETNKRNMTMELGDVLFSLVNVARLAKVHPETALSNSTHKFIRRFKQMETIAAADNNRLEELSKDEMARLWEKVKNDEPEDGPKKGR